MKKFGNILFLYFFVFVMCMGASFAWYAWQGADINVNVAFSSLDKYLEYRVVNIDDQGEEVAAGEEGATATKIEYQKKDIATNLDVYGNIYLTISDPTSEDVFKSSGFGWELYGVTDGNYTDLDESELISSGNFVGESETTYENGVPVNAIPAAINVVLSDDVVYIVKHVRPGSENYTNVDISGESLTTHIYSESIAPDDFDNGAGKINELYIRSIEYSAGKITNLGFYSSIRDDNDKLTLDDYPITGYMITNSEDEPKATDSGWTNVTSSAATTEPGYLANVSLNYTMHSINNICIKNSNNDVYCKSIGILRDVVSTLPDVTLCTNPTYTSSSQNITSVTGGTGYTLSNYNQEDAGTYTITASLLDGYQWNDRTTDNITFDCSIKQKDLDVSKFTYSPITKVYDGSTSAPSGFAVTATTSAGLISGDTVSVSYTGAVYNSAAAGTGKTIAVSGLNISGTDASNYKLSGTSYTKTGASITAYTLTEDMVTISPTSYTYDGNAKTPTATVTVTLNNQNINLTSGTDYTVTYSNNTNAGTATVTVTGKGNYQGTINKTFTIGKGSSTGGIFSEDSPSTI